MLTHRGWPLRKALSRRTPLSPAAAASRTSAYVYGNVLILTVLVSLSDDDARTGAAILIVLGTAFSTFLAHLFAGAVGASMLDEYPFEWGTLLHHTRDAVPVLTSGFVPAALLVLVWLGLAPGIPVLVAADVLLIVRIGSTGVVAKRLRGEPNSLRLVLTGVCLSLVGVVVVAIKVLLTH
jgi:hypothetical protein